MTKILFLSYYFPPLGGAGVQRAQKFVRYLPSEGFLPVVIAGPGPGAKMSAPVDPTLLLSASMNADVHRVQGPAPRAKNRLQGRLKRWFSLPGEFSKWWVK